MLLMSDKFREILLYSLPSRIEPGTRELCPVGSSFLFPGQAALERPFREEQLRVEGDTQELLQPVRVEFDALFG